MLHGNISVKVITRWRAAEVAAGVSELEVFEVCQNRSRAELLLLDNLHAKLYLADNLGLIGSANLTATALGWVDRSNVELLVPARRSDPEVSYLLQRLEKAEPATFALKSKIEEAASKLATEFELPEAEGISEIWKDRPLRPWLPQCAVPERLYKIYQSPQNVDVTRDDALDDLSVLNLPHGLDPQQFSVAIEEAIQRMPAMVRILREVPRQLSDAEGTSLISDIRPDLSERDARTQWSIVRDWIGEFFRDRFEVAAESFVVRIRPPGSGKN